MGEDGAASPGAGRVDGTPPGGGPGGGPARLSPGEVRQVAMLFAELQDLYGWEEVDNQDEGRRVIDRVYGEVSRIVASFGGCVGRSQGRMINATFGSRVASERDAERAVRAGLEIFDKLQHLNRYLSNRGLHVDVKAAVHLGAVEVDAAGALVGGEAVQVGLDLNRAAAVNTLLISRQTLDVVGDTFLYEHLGPIHIGQRDETVQAVRVLGLNPRGEGRWQRSTLARRSRFVGRAKVLQALQRAYAASLDPERWVWDLEPWTSRRRWVVPTFMGIKGEAGSGKSRLIQEIRARLADARPEAAPLLTGRADALAHVPYGLFVSLLKDFTGVQDEDSPVVRRRKLDASTRPLIGTDPTLKAYLPVIAFLVGVRLDETPLPESDPAALQEDIHIALTAWLRAAALYCHKSFGVPLILMLKDLHASDDRSVGALLAVLERARLPVPLYVLASWRTGWRRPAELGLSCRLAELSLGPLTHEEVKGLVASMLDGFELPRALLDRIQHLANGNPFFVEELIRNLVDTRVLTKTVAGWSLGKADAEISLPHSLAGLILSRVDTLPPPERETLLCAATVGVVVPKRVLLDVRERLGGGPVEAHLKTLVEQRFLRVIAAAREESYSFPNLLSREVVLSLLLPENRRLLHRLVAEALLRRYEGALGDHYGKIGLCFAEAGEPALAARYLGLAADLASREDSHDLALQLYQRYLEMEPAGPDAALARWKRARVLQRQGRSEEAAAELERLLAEGAGDAALQLQQRRELAEVYLALGRVDAAYHAAEIAAGLADTQADAPLAVEAHLLLARIARLALRPADARRHLDAAAALAEASTPADAPGRACIPSERGRLALAEGAPEEALAWFEEALRLHTSRDDREGRVEDLCDLAEALLQQGRPGDARVRVSEALALGAELGRRWVSQARMVRGAAVCLGGDPEGRLELERELDDTRRRGDRWASARGERLLVLLGGPPTGA